jgi:hypothetical protein
MNGGCYCLADERRMIMFMEKSEDLLIICLSMIEDKFVCKRLYALTSL